MLIFLHILPIFSLFSSLNYFLSDSLMTSGTFSLDFAACCVPWSKFRVNVSVLAWWLWRVKRTFNCGTTMNSCLIFQEAMFPVTYLITPLRIRSLM